MESEEATVFMVCMTVILIMDDHIRRLMEAGRAHSESQETKNRAAGDASSFHEGKKESRAPQTKETTSKFNLLNMRRLFPCRMSKHFRQGAELPTTKHLRHMFLWNPEETLPRRRS